MLYVCKNYRKLLFFFFACRNGNIFVPLHSSNQRTCASLFINLGLRRSFIKRRSNVRGATHVVSRKSTNNPIEGQDGYCSEDFPSAKVQSRCLQTKSPLLLRSKPIVKPMPNGRLMGENGSARGKHLFFSTTLLSKPKIRNQE